MTLVFNLTIYYFLNTINYYWLLKLLTMLTSINILLFISTKLGKCENWKESSVTKKKKNSKHFTICFTRYFGGCSFRRYSCQSLIVFICLFGREITKQICAWSYFYKYLKVTKSDSETILGPINEDFLFLGCSIIFFIWKNANEFWYINGQKFDTSIWGVLTGQ